MDEHIIKQIRDLEQKIFDEREDYKDMYAILEKENKRLHLENESMKMYLCDQLKSAKNIT